MPNKIGITFAIRYRQDVFVLVQGELVRAVADFTTAIHLDPEYAEAYQARAETYAALGEVEIALHDREVIATLEE